MSDAIDLSQVKWDSTPQASSVPQDASKGIDLSQVKWDSTPQQASSVATEGFDYFKDHPFKAVFQPALQTLTGKSASDTMMDNSGTPIPQAKSAPFDKGVEAISDPASRFNDVASRLAGGVAGSVVDGVTTPANYVGGPIAKAIGEIPVGSTNIGRIASNVALNKGLSPNTDFSKDVGELQKMESTLQQSGKLSSRGVASNTYNPQADQAILNYYNKIAQPSTGKFNSPSKLSTYNQKAVDAMKTINDFQDVTGADPTGSRQNLLDSVQSTKKAIWNIIDTKAQTASIAGATVDMGKVANNVIQPLLDNPSIVRQRPDIIPFLQKTLDSYKSSGKIGVDEAQNDLKILNDDIGKYMKSTSPADASTGAVKFAISQNMRQQMDSAIENALGEGGYQDLRNKYGSLSSVESDLTKAAARQAKASGGVTHPMLDVMTGVDLGKALLSGVTGNPAGAAMDVAKGGVMQVVKNGLDAINSPDAKISGMFKLINRAKMTPQSVSPLVQKSIPTSPSMIKNISGMSADIPLEEGSTVTKRPALPIDGKADENSMINEGGNTFDGYDHFNHKVSPNATTALLNAHAEVIKGNLQPADVQDTLSLAKGANDGKLPIKAPGMKVFKDISQLQNFVKANASKIERLDTDSTGKFYVHMKGK